MFYRVKDNKLLDYADYEYAPDCKFTDLCTKKEFEKNKENYTFENGIIEEMPNLSEVQAIRRKEEFEKEFFLTSLGWIRRKVNMKDGSKKDFLSDLLLTIKTGMDMNQQVNLIAYKTPNFYQELDEEYMESLRIRTSATYDFIQECIYKTAEDFWK